VMHHVAILQSCDYRRIVELLLRAALLHKEDFIQRIAIGLCNLLVCQVRTKSKMKMLSMFPHSYFIVQR